MNRQTWNVDVLGPISKSSVDSIYPTGYLVRQNSYEAHAVFQGTTRPGTCYVQAGIATYNDVALVQPRGLAST